MSNYPRSTLGTSLAIRTAIRKLENIKEFLDYHEIATAGRHLPTYKLDEAIADLKAMHKSSCFVKEAA